MNHSPALLSVVRHTRWRTPRGPANPRRRTQIQRSGRRRRTVSSRTLSPDALTFNSESPCVRMIAHLYGGPSLRAFFWGHSRVPFAASNPVRSLHSPSQPRCGAFRSSRCPRFGEGGRASSNGKQKQRIKEEDAAGKGWMDPSRTVSSSRSNHRPLQLFYSNLFFLRSLFFVLSRQFGPRSHSSLVT